MGGDTANEHGSCITCVYIEINKMDIAGTMYVMSVFEMRDLNLSTVCS